MIQAFTAEHVNRLTGLSLRQLSYWAQTNFFVPSIADDAARAFGRLYSFRDVVGLRTLALLRRRVPLQELRKVRKWLGKKHDEPWSTLKFYVVDGHVVFDDPDTGLPIEARGTGQVVMTVALEEIAHDMSAAAARLSERRPDQIGKIEQNRYVVHNAHVVAGTRVPTRAIWNFHLAGTDVDGIIAEYPRLTPTDVKAAIAFERKRNRVA
jgi:uncharacterized protein (DUF433 family)